MRCSLCKVTISTRTELCEHFEMDEHKVEMEKFAEKTEELLHNLDK